MPKARYEGIYRELRDRIQGGVYAYQELLPTENELTGEFSCSRNTLRRALSMLTDEAYIQPIHGKGVRVIWREETHNVTGVLEGDRVVRRVRRAQRHGAVDPCRGGRDRYL